METMQLTTAIPITGPTVTTDQDIEALFAAAGLDVDIVDTCDDAACEVCFARRPARAA